MKVKSTNATSLAMMQLDIMDVNEYPYFGTEFFRIKEDTKVGTVIGTLTALDPDEDDTLAISCTSDWIECDEVGAVKLLKALDFETSENHTFIANITDGLLETSKIFLLFKNSFNF